MNAALICVLIGIAAGAIVCIIAAKSNDDNWD